MKLIGTGVSTCFHVKSKEHPFVETLLRCSCIIDWRSNGWRSLARQSLESFGISIGCCRSRDAFPRWTVERNKKGGGKLKFTVINVIDSTCHASWAFSNFRSLGAHRISLNLHYRTRNFPITRHQYESICKYFQDNENISRLIGRNVCQLRETSKHKNIPVVLLTGYYENYRNTSCRGNVVPSWNAEKNLIILNWRIDLQSNF